MRAKSTLTLNTTAILKEHFSKVTINLKPDKAKTRYETFEGNQTLVVPCVMITEGVHEGSKGPLFYPAEELAKNASAWDGKPVVVNHPIINGRSVSACDPDVFEAYKIGVLFNTRWEDGKLKTECWIQEEKSNQVDDRVLAAVENGDMMEVSTGLFTETEKVEGDWKGKHYDSIARNYRPDHLAILPDLKGACSIEDGAGLLRNAKKEDTPEGRLANSLYKVFNELSHNEIWRELNNKINDGVDKDAWVIDVFDDFFIYEVGDTMYYQKYETIDGDMDEVSLIGVRQEVERIIQYKLADGTLVGNGLNEVHNIKENQMDKKKVIDALIANEKTAWTEDDRGYLMSLEEAKLTLHSEASKEEEPAAPAAVEPKPKEETVVEPKVEGDDKKTPAENKKVTMDEYIAKAPEGMQGMLKNGVATYNAQKAELIKKITANEKNLFTPEQLEAKDVNELTQLAAFVASVETQAVPAAGMPHFAGQAPLAPIANAEVVEEPLEIPVMNFSKKE